MRKTPAQKIRDYFKKEWICPIIQKNQKTTSQKNTK